MNKISKKSIMLPLLLLQVAKTLSPEQIKSVFQKFDSNNDGRLNKKEFKAMMDRQ